MTAWQPYREPLRATLTRTVAIALVAGAVLAYGWGSFARWPLASALMLWPSLGGHYLELWFLNWLRPRLSGARVVQTSARVTVWFLGGIAMAIGIWLTVLALTGSRRGSLVAWWIAGVAFIGIELVAHLALQLRGRPSFLNGRG